MSLPRTDCIAGLQDARFTRMGQRPADVRVVDFLARQNAEKVATLKTLAIGVNAFELPAHEVAELVPAKEREEMLEVFDQAARKLCTIALALQEGS